jgi:hypothetical protein
MEIVQYKKRGKRIIITKTIIFTKRASTLENKV